MLISISLKEALLLFPVCSTAQLSWGSAAWACSRQTFRQHPDIAEIYKDVNEALPGCAAVSAAELGQRLKLLGTLPAAHCCFFFFFLCQRSLSFEICLCHCMLRLTLWNDIIVAVMTALSLVPLNRYSRYRQWRTEWMWSVGLLIPAPTRAAQAAAGVQFTAAQSHWRHFSPRGAGKPLWVHEPLFAPLLRHGNLYSSSLG